MIKLAKLRKDKVMKQAELAQIMGVSQATISNWESGVHEPDSEQLMRLAGIFAVSTDFLLGHDAAVANGELDQIYYRIAQDAKNSGISSHDLQLAVNFLKMAKERDDNAKG